MAPLYLGCGPLQIKGKSTKGPVPSARSQISQGQAWEEGSWQVVVSCYSPGDHWLGLPLHTDAHGNILAFSY